MTLALQRNVPDYLQRAAKLHRLSKARHKSQKLPWLSLNLHPAQVVIANSNARFKVVACGRRFGKTTAAKRAALTRAYNGGVVWWVLPTYQMATEVWNDIKANTLDFAKRISTTERTIYFEKGLLAIKSGHEPDRLRGSGLDELFIDEAAYCHEDVWYALRPALSDKQGSATLLSTPQGRNWFWRMFQKAIDPLEPEWTGWHFPTRANPYISLSEIAAAEADMPEAKFRQEFEAKFLEDFAGVFRRVMEAFVPVTPRKGDIVMGVDWGRHNDYTAIVVLDTDNKTVLELDRFNQVSWELQRGRLKALADKWKPRQILAEANSIGEPNIEALQREGLPIRAFTTTASSKPPLIDALALAFEQEALNIVDNLVYGEILRHELQAYEMERLPSGTIRYGAPSGGHDDTVIALALAWRAAHTGHALSVSVGRYA